MGIHDLIIRLIYGSTNTILWICWQHCICFVDSCCESTTWIVESCCESTTWECRLFYRSLLQKRPIILRSLPRLATPYVCCGIMCVNPQHDSFTIWASTILFHNTTHLWLYKYNIVDFIDNIAYVLWISSQYIMLWMFILWMSHVVDLSYMSHTHAHTHTHTHTTSHVTCMNKHVVDVHIVNESYCAFFICMNE